VAADGRLKGLGGDVEGDDAEVEVRELDVGEAGVAHKLGEGGSVGEAGDAVGEVLVGVLLAGEEVAEGVEDEAVPEGHPSADEGVGGAGELEDGEAAAGGEDAEKLSESSAVVDKIAEAEADGDEVEACVAQGELEAVGLDERGGAFGTGADEHGEAEVSAEVAGRGGVFEGGEEVAGAAAEVEDTALGGEAGGEAAGGAPAPEAIDLESEEAIEEVVAGGDAGEHVADPGGGLGFGEAGLWAGTVSGHVIGRPGRRGWPGG